MSLTTKRSTRSLVSFLSRAVLCLAPLGLVILTGCGAGAGGLDALVNNATTAMQALQNGGVTQNSGTGNNAAPQFSLSDLVGTWGGMVTMQYPGQTTQIQAIPFGFVVDASGNFTFPDNVTLGDNMTLQAATAQISATGLVDFVLTIQQATLSLAYDFQGQMSADKTQIAMTQILVSSSGVSMTMGFTGTLTKDSVFPTP